jgi:hypothetical protein
MGNIGSRFQADCIAASSAGLGQKVILPFRPKGITKPIDLWKKPELAQAAL